MKSIIEWLLGTNFGKLSGGDWQFGLESDYNKYVNLALLAAFGVMVYLTIRSYRREGEASPRVKASLAGIRIAVIVLVFVILFQPAIVLRITDTIYKSLVILIDGSTSMSFQDSYADPEQREALEAFLGIETEGDEAPGAENSPQPVALTELTRMQLVQAALVRKGGALAKIAEDHPLLLMQFSTADPGKEAYTRILGAINAVKTDEAAKDDGDNPQPANLPQELVTAMADLKGDGHETNIRQALRDVLKKLDGRRVAGIVLISDGQVTAQATDLGGTKAYAAKRNVPLIAVCVGDPTPPKDLAVVGLQAPRQIRRETRAEFSVTLAHRNLSKEKVTLRLFRREVNAKKWVDTGVKTSVILEAISEEDGDSEETRGVQTVALQLEPKVIGEFIFKVVADARSDERDTENNSAESPVRVSDHKISVLLISCDAGWEYQYLRNYLMGLPDVYRVSTWQQNADEKVNQVASEGMKLARMPRKLEEMIGSPSGKPNPGYDVVILYDPKPTDGGFDGVFIKELAKYVKRHGKGLCYVIGNRNSDVMGSKTTFKPLVDMIPVVLAANTRNELDRIEMRRPEAWPIALTSYGKDHAITRLGGSAKESSQIWDVLPGMFWTHPVLKTKPTARVLAVTTNPLRRTSKNRPEPVLVVHSYGKGRVAYVGLHSTWRWRAVEDGLYQRRFWGNIVRYLATLGSRRVAITTGGDRFSSGQRITVEVEAYDSELEPLTDVKFELKMTGGPEKDKVQTIKLDAVKGAPGHYKRTIDGLGTGSYLLEPAKAMHNEGERPATKRIFVEPPQAETARREADEDYMRSVVHHKKNYLPIHKIDDLVDRIPPGKLTTVREDPNTLWDSPLPLLLIVVLLGVEWTLRKKHNMA